MRHDVSLTMCLSIHCGVVCIRLQSSVQAVAPAPEPVRGGRVAAGPCRGGTPEERACVGGFVPSYSYGIRFTILLRT